MRHSYLLQCRKVAPNLDTVESLLMSHETMDAELLKWETGIEEGLEKRRLDEACKCESIEEKTERSRIALEEMRRKTAKMKRAYGRSTKTAAKEERLGRAGKENT